VNQVELSGVPVSSFRQEFFVSGLLLEMSTDVTHQKPTRFEVVITVESG